MVPMSRVQDCPGNLRKTTRRHVSPTSAHVRKDSASSALHREAWADSCSATCLGTWRLAQLEQAQISAEMELAEKAASLMFEDCKRLGQNCTFESACHRDYYYQNYALVGHATVLVLPHLP